MMQFINNFFSIQTFLLVCFWGCLFEVHAHDEPAMTLRQRREFLKEHRQYAKSGIRTIMVYAIDERGERSLRVVEKLAEDGLPVLQQFYRADTLWKEVKMFYDRRKNFVMQLTEMKGSSDIHKDVFVFSRRGYVVGGVSFRNDTLIENFQYAHLKDSRQILFQKTDSSGNTIYIIEYRYQGNFHKKDYYWAQKRLTDGSVEITVEKIFDRKGRLIRKNVLRSDGQISYWFIYEYDKKGRLHSIERHQTDGKQTKTEFAYDSRGFVVEQFITTTDGVKQKIVYEYHKQ